MDVMTWIELLNISIVIGLLIGVLLLVKAKKEGASIKRIVLTLVSIAAVILATIIVLPIEEYIGMGNRYLNQSQANRGKDGWFYGIKDELMKQFDIIEEIELEFGQIHLSFYIELNSRSNETDISVEEVEAIFYSLYNKVFNNPEGNLSQRSFVSRRNVEYSQIHVFFSVPNGVYMVNENNRFVSVSYEGLFDYYGDETSNIIDDFRTWDVCGSIINEKGNYSIVERWKTGTMSRIRTTGMEPFQL